MASCDKIEIPILNEILTLRKEALAEIIPHPHKKMAGHQPHWDENLENLHVCSQHAVRLDCSLINGISRTMK